MKHFLTSAMLALLTIQSGMPCIMLAPGTALPGQAYIDAANPFLHLIVAIKRISPTSGFVDYATGIKIGPNQILTAAHVVDALGGNFNSPANLSVLTGQNFFEPNQNISVAFYRVHPSYIQGSGLGTGSQIDLAVIHTTLAMDGPYAQIGTTPLTNGNVLTIVGAGRPALYGTPFDSPEPFDGKFRACRGSLLDPTSQFNNLYYASLRSFTTSNFGIPGGASIGDSGGAGFGSDNLVYFLITAATWTSASVRTFGVDLTQPEVRNFITSEPPKLTITLSSTSTQLTLADLVRNRQYRVMRSTTLNSWAEAHRFTATSTSATWSESLAPSGTSFYRLEWNE